MEAVLTLFDGMITSIEGKLRNTHFPKSKPLSPLFEAVSNAIHAIEDAGVGKGVIDIHLQRERSDLFHGTANMPIQSIRVSDTGVGFDEDNFASFHTAESTHKLNRGSKGIGRFIWLKAFQQVSIESHFMDSGICYERKFDFVPRGNGVENTHKAKCSNVSTGTTVCLLNLQASVMKLFPHDMSEIASELMYHFMISFLMPNCPVITIHSEDSSIQLNEKFKAEINPLADKRTFKLKNERFELIILKNCGSSAKNHNVVYCANYRSVKTVNLKNAIADLNGIIVEGESKYVYACYVSGAYLDANVNAERTALTLADTMIEDTLGLELSLSDIQDRVVESIKNVLSDFLAVKRKEKEEIVQQVVNMELPQYRVVLKYSPDFMANLSPNNLTKEKLDVELYKEYQKIDRENKIATRKFLNNKLEDITNWEEYKERIEAHLETENDFGKAQLARYIAHRKTVLDVLEKHMGINTAGKYALEELIHNMIFPIRQESDSISYDKQNLWIIDERLAYHNYLASDKPFQKTNQNGSIRPDLLIYKSRFALVADKEPYQSVVIVEFKRPQRDDYTSPNDNPFDQVVNYARELRSGNLKDRNGKIINLQENTPFYAYIICDISPSLRTIALDRDYIAAPDNLGYYGYHKHHKMYIELISYAKLIKDANERNRILFEKLGLVL